MHFAVLARNLAIGINDNSGVVVQPWCGLFKNGIDDHHLVLFSHYGQRLGGRAIGRLCQVKHTWVDLLAEIIG